MRKSLRNIFLSFLKTGIFLLLVLFTSSLAYIIYLRWLPPITTSLMVIRSFEGGKPDNWKLKANWSSYENISNHLKVAVIAAEDQKFATHHGFDIEAIEKAMEHNKKGRRTRGASTISQQVAKNVFLWPGRSWLRKGLEVYFTAAIELLWPKERILEMYLNVAEMGDGIFGAEAAAQYYFKKPAKNLSREQAAGIAAILPNPRVYKAVNPGPYVRGRKANIQRFMWQIGGEKYLEQL